MTRRSAVTTTQAVAAKATEAADTLMAWLRAQPSGGARVAAAALPAAERPAADGSANPVPLVSTAAPPKPANSAEAATPTPAVELNRREPCAPLRLPHTDWLHHWLQITGPAVELEAFRTAAAGAGTVPWHLDLDRTEEDLFHQLIAGSSRSLSLAGARILAGQLREAAAKRHALAVARVGQSRVCPFDLHALIPVPDATLRHGPYDPQAQAWLWTHWGTTEMLRHVTEDETDAAKRRGRAAPGEAVWVLTFWSADWTPWRALAQITAGWPTLRFDIRPTYDSL
jgi:hypothetical protein